MTSIVSDFKPDSPEGGAYRGRDVCSSDVSQCNNSPENIKYCSNGEENAHLSMNDPTNYVFFTNISFITCKERNLSWTKAEITRLFHDLPDKFTSVKLAIPCSKRGYFIISSTDNDDTLLNFPFSQIINFNKGYDQATANYALITRVMYTQPEPADSQTNVEMHLTNTTGTTPAAYFNAQQSARRILKFYVFRSQTAYETTRIVDFLHKISCNDLMSMDVLPVWQPPKITLRLQLDLKELDASGDNYVSVLKEKSQLFKLRKDIEKRLCVTVSQIDSTMHLPIARLLDVCVGYGRYISGSELTYLGGEENVTIEVNNPINGTFISTYVTWPLKHPDFIRLNSVSSRDECIFFTVVVNLLICKLEKPLRLRRTCRARVYRPDEFFWLSFDKNPLVEDYSLTVVERVDENGNLWAGNLVDITDVIPSHKDDSPLFLSNSYVVLGEDQINDDENEPLMSGNGIVSQEVASDQVLADWGQLITIWHTKMKQELNTNSAQLLLDRTQQSNWSDLLNGGCAGPMIANLGSNLCQRIKKLVIQGVPDALRAEVWQLLAGCPVGESALMDAYRVLVNEPCEYDEVIRRDLARTFPANHFFRDKIGQDSLFHVSRAYALYDNDVGYCQGLTFFAAVLLLHMPVEQTFTLLVEVNNHYGVKDMFLNNLGGLHMRLYQLDRLIQDQLPDVHKHFADLGLETHMYASQWFLTLFTSKFPLHIVFHIVDLFLTEGMIFIFKVAISLLRLARIELLDLDFEGILKYLRVTMPKRYLLFEAYVELIENSITAKVTPSKLQKYAKEWITKQTQETIAKCPINLLECQISTLKKQVDELSRENQALAAKLLTSEVELHERGDRLEDKAELLTRELFASRKHCLDIMEEKARLESEVIQVKNMFRSLSDNSSNELKRIQRVADCYKLITSNLLKSLITNNQANQLKISESSSLTVKRELSDHDSLYLELTCSLLEQAAKCRNCTEVLDNYLHKYEGHSLDSDEVMNILTKLFDYNDSNNAITDEFQNKSIPCNRAELDEDDDTVVILPDTPTNNDNINGDNNNNNKVNAKSESTLNIVNQMQWLTTALHNLRALNQKPNPQFRSPYDLQSPSSK